MGQQDACSTSTAVLREQKASLIGPTAQQSTPSALGAAPSGAQPAAPSAPPQPSAHGDDEPVPTTWPEVLSTFFSHPSVLLPFAGITLCAAQRLAAGPLTALDALVFPAVVVFWWLQEYFLHAHLLHSKLPWFGRDIHDGHHAKPYFHVSIDDTKLIGGVMGVTYGVFYLLFGGGPLAATAFVAYASAGLWYEWAHYLVHCHYVPSSRWLRHLRRHHMLHHLRNEGYWHSFSLPAIDALFGTLPRAGSAVPMSEVARRSHAAAKAGAAASPPAAAGAAAAAAK